MGLVAVRIGLVHFETGCLQTRALVFTAPRYASMVYAVVVCDLWHQKIDPLGCRVALFKFSRFDTVPECDRHDDVSYHLRCISYFY